MEKGKRLIFGISLIILFFYFSIMLYVLFGILHINVLKNFICSLIFEGVGFSVLIIVVMANIGRARVKIGYYVPIIVVTVFYTILLNVLNICGTAVLQGAIFFLMHLVLLFLYLLVVVPMCIMGKQ